MAWELALLVVTGIVVLVQLMAVNRQRRLFLFDPQRRRFFLSYMQRWPAANTLPLLGSDRAEGEIANAAPQDYIAAPAMTDTDEAVIYVDAAGECTFANRAARELLHWTAGHLALQDLLAGGRGESEALMESLARRGLVEQHPTALAGPTHAPLEINAVAVRDRDDNLWGAALFIRRAAGAVGVGGSRPGSTRH